MKPKPRSAMLGVIAFSLPWAIACGSRAPSELFAPTPGGAVPGSAGSLSDGGTSDVVGPGVGGAAQSSGGSGLGGADAGWIAGAGSAGSMASGGASGTSASAGLGGSSAVSSGASTGSGGAGGSGGASGASGGSGGKAGSSGTGGSAGAAGMSGCTAAPPVDGGACTAPTPNSCFYPGLDCSCVPQNNGAPFRGRWACVGSGRPLCPPALPATGDSCLARIGAECPYSSTDVCVCAGNLANPRWNCSADKPFTCPAALNPGAPCSPVAICQFPNNDCLCSVTWQCQGG